MECIELCRLLTGHVAWMDEQLGDLRLEAILGAILCTCYGEWTAFEKEKAAMVQQWNALENLSSLDTWKWIYGTRQRVENMLGRVQILTSVFDIFHSTESTNANILVENVQDWEKCVKEKQSVIQITLEAAMQVRLYPTICVYIWC